MAESSHLENRAYETKTHTHTEADAEITHLKHPVWGWRPVNSGWHPHWPWAWRPSNSREWVLVEQRSQSDQLQLRLPWHLLPPPVPCHQTWKYWSHMLLFAPRKIRTQNWVPKSAEVKTWGQMITKRAGGERALRGAVVVGQCGLGREEEPSLG